MSISRVRALAKAGAALLLFSLALVIAPSAHANRARPFAVSVTVPTGNLKTMALGDIDEDGRADLVGSAYVMSSLVMSRSLGAGAFSPPQSIGLIPDWTLANSLDFMDRDGDGHLDLVVSTGDTLQIFTGDGHGGFARGFAMPFPVGAKRSNSHAWADLDDDGQLDLISPSRFDGRLVMVARSSPGGGFSAPETLWMPQIVSDLRMADANADGRLDLYAYSDQQHPTNQFRDSVSVFIAGPGATWQAPIVSIVPGVAAVGDQDGDGRADLWCFRDDGCGVWRRGADGTFAPGVLAPRIEVDLTSYSIVADQDGDGRGDLLAEMRLNAQSALVLLRSLPDGTLKQAGLWGGADMYSPIGLADMDGDGLLDVVVGGRDYFQTHVMFGAGPERLEARMMLPAAFEARAPSSVALTDLDRDGRADVLFASASGNEMTVYRSEGNGGFEYRQSFQTPTFPEGLEVADLNGDGWDDVAIAGADGPIASQAFALNQGDGSFGAPQYLSGLVSPTASQALSGQFDRDGLVDLLYAGAPRLRVAWNQGGGGFAALDSLAVGGGCPVNRVAVGHVDMDALDDLVFISGADSLGVAFADGFRGMRSSPRIFVGGLLSDIALRDLDTDGRGDVVLLDCATSTVVVLRSLGTGLFAAPVRYAVGDANSFPAGLVLGDVDTDGFIDLVVSNARDRNANEMATVTVWYNDHFGGFVDRADLQTGPFGGRLALGDVDGNGTLDLGVANGRGWLNGFLGSGVSVMLNTSPSPPTATAPQLANLATFAIPQVWPNPLRRGGDIRLDLVTPSQGELVVELLDLQGRRVLERKFAVIAAGRHSLALSAQGVPPGMYFARATQGTQSAAHRVVVLN